MFVSLFLLSFASFVAFCVGLIKPSWFKLKSRKQSSIIFLSLSALFFISSGFVLPDESQQEPVYVAPYVAKKVVATSTDNVVVPTSTTQIVKAVEQKVQEVAVAPKEVFYQVTSVVDGDTLKVMVDGKEETLRLIGMDTPETVDPRKPVQCFGKEASDKAKELLSGKKVKIETDASQGVLDKYGRTLAYVYREDGLFYNKHMIEQGYAHEYTYNIPYKYQDEFKTAQASARAASLGLWSSATCAGDTTLSAATETTAVVVPIAVTSSGGKYYTSSHYSAKYYYPESCGGWKGLSPKYLKSFNTLGELLAAYPSRTESSQCN